MSSTTEENIPKTPVLVRTLSSQHWEAASLEMARTKTIEQWAGTCYDTDGNITWKYHIVRNSDGKTATMFSNHYGEQFIEGVIPIPIISK
jgi:hypothetical protein